MLIPEVTVGVTKRITSTGSGKLLFDFVHLCAKCADFFVFKGTLALRNTQKCSNIFICMNLLEILWQ